MLLTRKRKVDSQVVEAVTQELLHDPLAEIGELQQRVNARLGRDDLSATNIKVALEQIPYGTVRDSIRKQIAKGKAHYEEEHLLREMMLSESCKDMGEKAGIQMPEAEGMQVSDPTSIRHLVTPGFGVSSIASSLRWVIFCLVMYYHGVPLSVLGSWFGVSKTTILRRMLGLVLVLWPIVYGWILDNVRARAEVLKRELRRAGVDAFASKDGLFAILCGAFVGSAASPALGTITSLSGMWRAYRKARRKVLGEHWSSWLYSVEHPRFSLF